MSAFDPTAKVTSSGTLIHVPTERAAQRFSPGQVVAGIYRIDRLVGEGGMGTVLAATHLPTGRGVALKVLQPDAAADESGIARFWREVRAMGRLTHPNVVRIFDVGALADDTPYMAMAPNSALSLNAVGQTGGSQPHDNFQPYLCVNFIISLFGIFPSPT
jgi:serine/threonine-protein kinase